MPSKNRAAQELGRLGGKARSARLTAEERSQAASKAARDRWAGFTPEQRSAEMKRRRKKGLKAPRP